MSQTYRPLLIFLATLQLWLPALRSEAQSREPTHKKMAERNVQEGEALLEHELYFEAAQFFEKAAKLDPENLAATYQLAECHRLTFHYEQAEKGYGKTVYAQSADYPLALFYYALMQKMNGKYAESAQNFAAFLHKADSIRLESPPMIVARARTEMTGCEMARKQETLLRRNYEHRLLPAPLNTPSHEYAPLTAGWDSLLVITSTRPGAKGRQQDSKLGQALSDFYRFESPDTLQTWQPGSKGDQLEKINTKWGEGSGSFNRACDRFYFTSCQQAEARCEIFVTQLKNGKWQEPVKLNPNINEPGYDSRHPALSPGGDTLFFASNRPNGAGMNDLWMSTTAGGDFWGPAMNLGNSINTPLNELSPFFDEQEKVLFFASDGHQSLGGLDMFIAKKAGRSSWKVTNMGPPFNSNRDDAFLTLGKAKGYMASNRPGGVGNFDIYTFSLMSNETAIASLNRSKGTHSPDLAYLKDYKLDYFPKEDQFMIDRLVSQKKTEHLHQVDLVLTKEEDAFYQQLSNQEKQTVDRAASHLFGQMDLPEQEQSKTRDEGLFQLSPPNDQTRLNRMAEAHRQAAVAQTTLTYPDEDARYYEGLSLPEKKLLDGILASGLKTNGATVAARREKEKFLYEKLPLSEKNRIDRVAAARLARLQGNANAELSAEDEQFYAALTPEEKATFDQLVKEKMVQMLIQQKGLGPAAFDYQRLPLEDQQRINRIAASRRAAQLNNQPVQLSQEDQRYYDQLPKEEKAKFDRLVEVKMTQLAIQKNKARFAGFRYEQLPLEEQRRIDRVAAARLARLQGNENARLSEEDERFYAALTPDEKAAFDQLVNAKMTELLARQKGLRPADFDYQQLPLEDQRRINRIAAARRAAQLNNQPVALSQEDQLYYNQLSKAEKAKFDQLVEVKMNQLASQESKARLKGFNYELLPLEERKRIDRIVAARRAALQNNQPVQLSEEDQRYYDQLSAEDKQQIDKRVAFQSPSSLARVKTGPPRIGPKVTENRVPEEALHTFQTGNFESISLKGQVLQADTALPVKGLEVLLVNEAGVPEKLTTTDAKGRFQYIRLAPDKQYSIQVNEPPVRLTQPSSYRIKDLQMLGYGEKVSDIRHEPVYFDFNRYAIRPEARKVLEALIALCRANPDMQIEINAFTDPIGSEEYNLELSRKRGREVQNYLVEHGVNPNALVMRFQGEDWVRYGTNQAAGRQANRRVEFLLKGAPTGYQSDVYTYIMQSKSTVSSLAKLFGMSVPALKALNDFTSDTIDAYRPVRVRNHQKVTPALLLRPDPGKKVRPK